MMLCSMFLLSVVCMASAPWRRYMDTWAYVCRRCCVYKLCITALDLPKAWEIVPTKDQCCIHLTEVARNTISNFTIVRNTHNNTVIHSMGKGLRYMSYITSQRYSHPITWGDGVAFTETDIPLLHIMECFGTSRGTPPWLQPQGIGTNLSSCAYSVSIGTNCLAVIIALK